VRRLYGKLYEDFEPKYYYWKMVQFLRKFLIALATIMFENNPMLQTGFVLLVLFISFAIQMRIHPYMNTRRVTDVDYVHISKSEKQRLLATSTESKIRRYGRILANSSQSVGAVPARGKSIALRDKNFRQLWRYSVRNVITLNKIAPERMLEEKMPSVHPLGSSLSNHHVSNHHNRNKDLLKILVDTLFDYNALEAISLASLIVLLLVGLMLQGLLFYRTNVSGLETFENLDTSGSTPSLVANIFVLFFIGLIWVLFVVVSILMTFSVIIDVGRNVSYHIIDKASHAADYINRMTHFKDALKTASKNVNELGKQERKLEQELRKMQVSHTHELEAMQKNYERKKREMEEEIAKAKITHLRLKQEAKLLQIRMKKDGDDGPTNARLAALISEINKGDEAQVRMKDEYNRIVSEHKENSRALLDRCLQEQEKHRAKLQERIRRRKREAKTEATVHGQVMALNDVTEIGEYKPQVKLTVAKRNLADKLKALDALNSHVDSLEALHRTHFEGDEESQEQMKLKHREEDKKYLDENMKILDDQHSRDIKELELERQARLHDARNTQSRFGEFSKEVERINAEYDRERVLRMKEMENEKKAHSALIKERIRKRKARRDGERRAREQAILDKQLSAEQLQEELNDKMRAQAMAEEEAQSALLLYQQSKHLMEEDLKRSSALHHSKLQERLARRRRKKKVKPHPPPPPNNEILEHARKAQNLHNMLQSLYLSTTVQVQQQGQSGRAQDQLLTSLLSSMKALLDATKIEDLNNVLSRNAEKGGDSSEVREATKTE